MSLLSPAMITISVLAVIVILALIFISFQKKKQKKKTASARPSVIPSGPQQSAQKKQGVPAYENEGVLASEDFSQKEEVILPKTAESDGARKAALMRLASLLNSYALRK